MVGPMGATPLADAFLAARGAGEEPDREALEAHLRVLCAAAEEAWPAWASSSERLATALGRACEKSDPLDLERDAAVEVALAAGCADKDAAALEAFEARYLATVPAALAHMRLDKAVVDEVQQQVREKLLVAADGEEAKVLRYAGRGALRGLVKVVAVRAAISLLRKGKHEIGGGDDELHALPSPEQDPELRFMKERYRSAFRAAFETAIRGLDSHDRNLLRLHFVGEMTFDELSRMYGVHRSTVVRSVKKARDRIFKETRNGLRRELRIGPAELESIMELIRSRLDVSVGRMLRTMDPR
jgi:RNA polymerase sigma-70 factor (ECF subfamily)